MTISTIEDTPSAELRAGRPEGRLARAERTEPQPESSSPGSPRQAQPLEADGAPSSREAPPAEAPARRRSARRPFLVLGLVALLGLAGVGTYLAVTANQQTTDDAQVEADVVPVGARVSGQVRAVHVVDNQTVQKGERLFELDDRDFAARVAQAEAELATAQAQARAADAQVTVASATAVGGLTTAKAMVSGSADQVSSADAQIDAAAAALKRSQADARKAALELERTQALYDSGAVPKQQLDNAVAANDAAAAAVDLAQAQRRAAEQSKRVAQSQVAQARGRLDQSAPIDSQIEVAKANAALAHARVAAARAALELAKLQLSYTVVTAPDDGMISKLSVHPGQLVQAGQPLVEFVPATSYVVANFKETQIADIREGARATIEVDAYPDQSFEGRVESLSGATGARFALLPPDNASGNFVKVVQRVPVRIRWVAPPRRPIPAGLSAVVTVYEK